MAIVAGLWGGSGGVLWDDGAYTGIKKIQLSHGDAIGFLQVVYDINGQTVSKDQHPTNNRYSFKIETINLASDECIVKVSGYIGCSSLAQRTVVIRSLAFTTNKRKTYGPYGVGEGTPFDFPLERGKIVGFKGASGDLLDAIGFYVSS